MFLERLKGTLVVSIGLMMGAGCFTSAHASIVHLAGTTVDFYYDNSNPGMAAYGTLGVVGDTIFATPGNFRSESNDGVGTHTGTPTDSFSAYGVVRVVAKAGYRFVGIDIAELGDYRMSTGSTAVNASVDVDGWAHVYEYSGAGLFGQIATQNLAITGDLTLHDSQLHNWRGDVSFDLDTVAWAGITDIGLGLQNNLTAFSNGIGVNAWIQKKAVAGAVGMEIVTVSVVPVPAAVWLFGSGLVGLVSVARKRKR